MDKATTSAPEAERPETDSVEGIETADIEGLEKESEPSPGYSLEGIPEEHREVAAKILEAERLKIDRGFKADYTRKRQIETAELKKYKTELENYKKLEEEILNDPSRLDYYRQQRGLAKPEIKNVDDLLSYTDQRLEAAEKKAAQNAEERVLKMSMEKSWDMAFRADPNHERLRDHLVQEIEANPELQNIFDGENFKDVVDAAYKTFKMKYIDPEIKQEKAKIFESLKKKAASSTIVPGKNITTELAPGTKLSKEEALERIKQRLGT